MILYVLGFQIFNERLLGDYFKSIGEDGKGQQLLRGKQLFHFLFSFKLAPPNINIITFIIHKIGQWKECRILNFLKNKMFQF